MARGRLLADRALPPGAAPAAACLAAAAMALPTAAAQAGGTAPLEWRWWLGGGIEWFEWEEFFEGSRIVEETGPRFTIESGIDTRTAHQAGPVVALVGRLTLGRVDYDGRARTGGDEPRARSDTDYRGFHAVTEAGYRFELHPDHLLELTGGLELDGWSRMLQDTDDVDDPDIDEAAGYTENYLLLTARAATGLSHRVGDRHHIRWQVGGRYPFLVDEYDTGTETPLNPEGRGSIFADLEWQPVDARWSLRLYYEEYTLDDSDWEPAGVDEDLLVKQPRSESYRAGIALRYRVD